MAVHFSTLLAMPTSARSPINPLCRPPLTTHNWSPSTIACSPLLLPLLHACYTRTTCSALLLQCPDCTLAQPLPLPTANSAACLTHSTTVRLWLHHRSHRCCCRCYMPATRALPALRCYCSAPTALSPSPCLSQRLSRQRILGAAPSPSLPDHTRQHPLLATQTSAVATTTCLDYLRLHTRTMRPSTALPTYAYRYSQRILVRHPRPSHPDQTHTTAQLWLHKHPHCQQTTCMHLLSMLVGLRASTWPPLPFVHPEHSPSADI